MTEGEKRNWGPVNSLFRTMKSMGFNLNGDRHWDSVEMHLRMFDHLPVDDGCKMWSCKKFNDGGREIVGTFLEKVHDLALDEGRKQGAAAIESLKEVEGIKTLVFPSGLAPTIANLIEQHQLYIEKNDGVYPEEISMLGVQIRGYAKELTGSINRPIPIDGMRYNGKRIVERDDV